jgi:cellulose synthase/poly-beta-1,6-N-acetylglucosamine synthase-like glycosyltransferase
MNENWILSLTNYYLHFKPKLLVAPVVFEPQNNLFQKFQALEFMSLMGSGAGAIGINRPIMCNGANLLFEKSIYENTVHNNTYASGDDIFLMLHTKKEFRKEIHFIKSTEALVYTKPVQTVNELFGQRIRWTSKSKAYRDFDILFSAIIVALSNLFLVLFLIGSAFIREFLLFFLFAFIVKSIVDLILLVPVSRFFNQQKLLWLFLPLQLIYPFYISFTAFAGLVGKFSWKNRIYSDNKVPL